jgi:DNA polymerase I
MTFKTDYRDGTVYRWSVGDDGAEYDVDAAYTPTIFVSGNGRRHLNEITTHLEPHPDVRSVGFEAWCTMWRNDPEPVLRLDVETIDAVTEVAHEIRGWGDPGEYKLYNVDFAREFRYCLETGLDPTPSEEATLSTLRLSLPPKALSDDDVTALRIDDDPAGDSPDDVLDAVTAALETRDPDVLVVSSSHLVPLLYETAAGSDREDFELGRLSGYQQLARESTFESYGQVGHSPARYNVFGRAVIDVSNSFFWRQTNLDGLLDLVGRSWKPLQETSWASIGNVLTSIQIREAIANDVLVPWNSWRHEKFKSMSTLHEADRGGFIFSPDVGFHEKVHELDFASLYPNIMITRNVSPDKIRCECHSERADVPGLGYSICDEQGFIVDVLEPIITDREAYKSKMAEANDEELASKLQGRSSALKWILVSCFGYQGFSNAKFGRIECHEAINAFAREILLDTKEILESNGWRVVHGIVDSVWVQAIPGEPQTPLREVASEVTDEIGITLEYEAAYDWIAFVPRKDSEEGALNRYFGKVAESDEFKKRGIELRQRSTPPFIETCQTEWLEVLDEHREPESVCERLQVHLSKLRSGVVDPSELVIQHRVSKDLDEYTQYTRSVAALDRAGTQDFDVPPGEDIEYVVVDDDKSTPARVRLVHENPNQYDTEFYADLLIRAAESILSPLGWRREGIRRYLSDTKVTAITAY